MSLGVANNIALSGLRFTSLGTRIVAENLANSDIEGYGLRRSVASGTVSAGSSAALRGAAVIRDMNMALLHDARNADTARQGANIRMSALSDLETAFGLPGAQGALSTLFTQFDANLRQAAVMPESSAALQAVAQDAARIVSKFNSIGERLNSLRLEADAAIFRDVNSLNEQLDRVASLNQDIQRQTLLGGDPFALLDERERTISQIAQFLPISEIPRENNRTMLVSNRGEVLVDLEPAQFSFTPAPAIGASDTRASGMLSGIWLNGRELSQGNQTLSNGRLGANLDLRDTTAANTQSSLDRLALDLLTRFSGPSADISLGLSELGLFTRPGAATLPTDPIGLAQEMRLSGVIDPSDSNSLWRLRSGLNATAPGPSHDPENLGRMIDALSVPRALDPGAPLQSMSDNAAEQLSKLATARLGAETDLAFAQTSYAAKQETLAGQGVDSDAQMQNLLKLERAYAANAKVLSTVDDMLRQLLEI